MERIVMNKILEWRLSWQIVLYVMNDLVLIKYRC
jgi:hypothetical protein